MPHLRLLELFVLGGACLLLSSISSIQAEEVILKKVVKAGDTHTRLNFDNQLEETTVVISALHNWVGSNLAITAGAAGVWDGISFKAHIPNTWNFPDYMTWIATKPTSPAIRGGIGVQRFLSNGEFGFLTGVDDRDTHFIYPLMIGVTNAGGFVQLKEEDGTSEMKAAFSGNDFSSDGSAVFGVFSFQVTVVVDGEPTVVEKQPLGWRFFDGSDLKVWSPGEDAPGVEGNKQTPGFVPLVILDDRTILAFTQVSESGLFTNAQSVYYLANPDGSLEKLFRSQGERYDAVESIVKAGTLGIPHLPGPGLDNVHMNSSRHIAFGTLVIPDEGSTAAAIFSKAPDGSPVLVATKGTPIINADGETTGTFDSVNHKAVLIDDRNNITFEAEKAGAGENTVWRYLAEEKIFMRVGPVIGAPVPGIENSNVRRASMIAMNSAGRMVLLVDGFGDSALVMQSEEGVLAPVIINGVLADGSETGVFWSFFFQDDFRLSENNVLAMNISTDSGNAIYTANLASEVVPIGTDYIWDGGADTDDWHTVVDGRSNWVDAFGTPWPQPPGGGSGNEELLIRPSARVQLNANASISDLELDEGATLVVKSNLSFKDLLSVKTAAQLHLHSGSIQSSFGALKSLGDILKLSSGNFELKVVEFNLEDAELSVEEGTLLVESEESRFQGEGAEVKVTAGLLNLNSKNISLESNTVFESSEDGSIKVGSEHPDATLSFSGGTEANKRRLTFKGLGIVEIYVPFKVGLTDEVYVENSRVQGNEGVIVNLPSGKVIEAIGDFFNFGIVTLQRGGLVGEVESTGVLIVQAANANDVISIGGTSVSTLSRIELHSDAKYTGMLTNGPGSDFRTYGATLTPTNPTEDVLIFDKRSKLFAKEGINEIEFPFTELSRLNCPVNIEESARLEISNSKMTGKVKIVVEAPEGSVTLDDTEFEFLDISGPGEAVFTNRLIGTKGGGVTPDHMGSGFGDLDIFNDHRPPTFILKTETFFFDSAHLLGSIFLSEESVKFNIGDYSQRTSANPKYLGIADGLKIGPDADLIIGSSAAVTTQQSISLVNSNLFNFGLITLGHSLFADKLGFIGQIDPLASRLVIGSKSHRGILRIPEGLSDSVAITSDLLLAFGNNVVEVGDGSQLNIIAFLGSFAREIVDTRTLPLGDWIVGNGASLLFPKDDFSGELLPINIIRGKLTIGTAPEETPSINGFPNRNTDLEVHGGLTLKNTVLNFDVRTLIGNEPVRGKLRLEQDAVFDVEDSTINGADLLMIPSFRVSVAQLDQAVINGDTTMGGSMGLGASPGESLINGDFIMLPEGRVNIEFAGTEAKTQYDQLEVTGTASLDGTLVLHLLDGYEPDGGEQFEFLMAPTFTGSFAKIDQIRLGRNVRFDFATGNGSMMATAMAISIGSYFDWKTYFFNEADADNDEVSGQLQDPDKDGASNIEEYAMGGIPTLSESSSVALGVAETDSENEYLLSAAFNWVDAVTDVDWTFEKSSDLVNWDPLDPTISSESDGETSRVSLSSTVIDASSDPIFIRVVVDNN